MLNGGGEPHPLTPSPPGGKGGQGEMHLAPISNPAASVIRDTAVSAAPEGIHRYGATRAASWRRTACDWLHLPLNPIDNRHVCYTIALKH